MDILRAGISLVYSLILDWLIAVLNKLARRRKPLKPVYPDPPRYIWIKVTTVKGKEIPLMIDEEKLDEWQRKTSAIISVQQLGRTRTNWYKIRSVEKIGDAEG